MKSQTLFYRHVLGIALAAAMTTILGLSVGCKQAEKLAADLNSRDPSTDSSTNPPSFTERIELSTASPSLWSASDSFKPLGQLSHLKLNNQTLRWTDSNSNTSLIIQTYKDNAQGGGFEILAPHASDLFRLQYSYTSTTKSFHMVRSIGNTVWLLFEEANQFKIWGLDINTPTNPYVIHELSLSTTAVSDFEAQDGWLIVSGSQSLERWNIQDLTQLQSLSPCQGLQEAQVAISNSNVYIIEKGSSQLHLLNSQCQKQVLTSGLAYSQNLLHFRVQNQKAFIVGGSGAEIFDLQSQQVEFDLQASAGTSYLSADSEGASLVVLTSQNILSVWDTDRIQEIGYLQSYHADNVKIQRSQQDYYLYGFQNSQQTSIAQLILGIY